jgi:AhpD family alkylhydroperoxidase
LQGYLGFTDSLASGTLGPHLSEQIALTVAQTNDCQYCLAAHSTVGKMIGLNEDQILDARQGRSNDVRTEAVLRFAQSVTENRGWVSDEDLDNVRNAGYDDEEITEIIAHVVLNIFRNYFNHIAATPIDFPKAAPLPISV